MYLDVLAGDRDWRDIYRLCIGFINPRPIALVSTCDATGQPNLAPYSFYTMVCAHPPIVLFCPTAPRAGGVKDTLHNIRATGEFVIATVHAAMAEGMNRCAASLPPGASEWAFSGLTAAPATHVRPALVRESPANLECRLREIKSFGTGPGAGNVVFGEVIAIHVADEFLDPSGLIDPHKLSTVGRLGGHWYANVTDPYALRIPPV